MKNHFTTKLILHVHNFLYICEQERKTRGESERVSEQGHTHTLMRHPKRAFNVVTLCIKLKETIACHQFLLLLPKVFCKVCVCDVRAFSSCPVPWMLLLLFIFNFTLFVHFLAEFIQHFDFASRIFRSIRMWIRINMYVCECVCTLATFLKHYVIIGNNWDGVTFILKNNNNNNNQHDKKKACGLCVLRIRRRLCVVRILCCLRFNLLLFLHLLLFSVCSQFSLCV